MKRRRRPGRWILILLIVALITCGILFRFVFIIRNVEIMGNTGNLSADGVVRAASVGFGESIFRLDEQAIARRLNATGVLRMEEIGVHYPDTVYISVQPRTRTAMALHLGRLLVLDEYGYVVETLDQVPNEDLIYVSGMQIQGYSIGDALRANADQLSACCAVMQAVKANSAGVYVSELQINDPRNLIIITRTGITVELGDAKNMQDKIAWLKSAVQDLENRGEYSGTLDVSSGTKADYRSAVK